MFHDFKSEIKLLLIVAVASVLIAVAGIFLLKAMQPEPAPTPSPGSNTQVLEGIVRFESLGGGCWYLQVPSNPGPLEDIEKYELLGVSEAVLNRYRDQQVAVKGNTREDMASICQIGTIFEVEEISSANGNNQQPTIDTSVWQTYRNAEFGFEFEYSPKEWQLMEGDAQEDYGNIVWLFPRDSIGESSEPEIIIAIAHRPLEQEKEKREATSSDLEYNYSKTTIGGRIAYSSALLPGFHGLVREVLIDAHNDKTFIVSSNAIDELDQILSTFRFVDPATQIQWNWELLGCGGQTPCSYRVSSSEWPNSYVCAGKYNPLSGQGEITPTTSTDPRTAVDFTCSKE